MSDFTLAQAIRWTDREFAVTVLRGWSEVEARISTERRVLRYAEKAGLAAHMPNDIGAHRKLLGQLEAELARLGHTAQGR